MTNTSTRNKVLWAIATILVLVYALFPVASILATSFKSPSDLTSGKFLPSSGTATTSNYEQMPMELRSAEVKNPVLNTES